MTNEEPVTDEYKAKIEKILEEEKGKGKKEICELRFSAPLSPGGPAIPFSVTLTADPPGVFVTPEKCMPVLVRAQELAQYAGMMHDKFMKQQAEIEKKAREAELQSIRTQEEEE